MQKTKETKKIISGKKKVKLGKLIRKTPGGRHGWFESNVGIIKKPLK